MTSILPLIREGIPGSLSLWGKQDLFSSVIWYNTNMTGQVGPTSPGVIEHGKAIKRG